MGAPRFYVTDLHLPTLELPAAESRHAVLSLRLSAGDPIELFDGRGGVAQAEIIAGADKGRGKNARGVLVRLKAVRQESPPQRTLTLIVAGCKGARLDWLIEKCTELDVTRIVLADFERSVVHVSGNHVDKLLRTAIEACKQCGRNRLPELAAGIALAKVPLEGCDRLLICDPTESVDWLSNHMVPVCNQVAAVIGPEGGLSSADLDYLRHRGGRTVRLSQSVLRVETAAITAAAIWSGVISQHLRECSH